MSTPARVTISTLTKRRLAGEAPFAALTCYDSTTARWLARAGVHVLLVGDTAAEMVLGFNRTIDMPLDVLIALTAGVHRGSRQASIGVHPLVMGDMPFMSYHAGQDQALVNAGRFITEGLADIVKLEADESFAPLIARMVRAGIPVCGHIGSRPQRVAITSGYAGAGRTEGDAEQIERDARALLSAGCQMLLIEAVPSSLAERIVKLSSVPVIGIGAGPSCDGQVLVLPDLLGTSEKPPVFASAVTNLGEQIEQAGSAWVKTVAARAVANTPAKSRGGEKSRQGS